MENIKYFLVLEKRPGDYVYIDINRLDICNRNINNELAIIDGFTSQFSEADLRESIIRSNMASSDYLDGNLKIISDAKHNLKVLTKDIYDNVMDVVNGNIILNKNMKNKLFSVFKNIIDKNFDDLDVKDHVVNEFKKILKDGTIEEVFKYINLLPYIKCRPIYFMLYDELNKEKEINIKKLEKINDSE